MPKSSSRSRWWLRKFAARLRRMRPASPASTLPGARTPEQQALAEYILGFATSPEAEEYARVHLDRLLLTLELTPRGEASQSALEMGTYLQITPALGVKLGYGQVRGSDLGPAGGSVEKTIVSRSGESFSCTIDLFNAEADPFPYVDASFDTVLCCEILEHLEHDPMHMMAEINRITKSGGYLVMSTPNSCSRRAVAAVLTGWQPQHFSQYILSKEGRSAPEPKHIREYAPRELPDLLHGAGFETLTLRTGPCGNRDEREFAWVTPMLVRNSLSTELRDEGIFIVGRKTGAVVERFPQWLYC